MKKDRKEIKTEKRRRIVPDLMGRRQAILLLGRWAVVRRPRSCN
jgi:hypothetical protein